LIFPWHRIRFCFSHSDPPKNHSLSFFTPPCNRLFCLVLNEFLAFDPSFNDFRGSWAFVFWSNCLIVGDRPLFVPPVPFFSHCPLPFLDLIVPARFPSLWFLVPSIWQSFPIPNFSLPLSYLTPLDSFFRGPPMQSKQGVPPFIKSIRSVCRKLTPAPLHFSFLPKPFVLKVCGTPSTTSFCGLPGDLCFTDTPPF